MVKFVGRVIVAVLVIFGSVAVAGPAHATPTCTTFVLHDGAFVPSTSGGSVNCIMGFGDVSDGVVSLQITMNQCYPTQLRNVGVFPLVIDGDFGGHTQTALKAVQRAVGTTADGVYGPQTRQRMRFDTPSGTCIRVS